jgi:SOS-response transcriptional repressor LexA
MRNTRPLTIRQAEALDFIRAFYDRNDQLPPVDTIAEHFGFASRNAAHEMLLALERKGHIERNEVGSGASSAPPRPSSSFTCHGRRQPPGRSWRRTTKSRRF